MKWTKEQQEAIDLRNKNILVSAAAGSGKTAVLVERIKTLIIEENMSIDSMLIVTFTNAAAAEMKAKIRKAIMTEISNEFSKDENKSMEKILKLKNQLSLLPSANISTFHGFALEVIENFYYLTNINPALSICDDAAKTILEREALDETVERNFQSNNESFTNFLNRYSGDRNEDVAKEMISNTFKIIQSLPNPLEFLHESVELLKSTKEEFNANSSMEIMWESVGKIVKECKKINEEVLDMLIDFPRIHEKLNRVDGVYLDELEILVQKKSFDHVRLKLQNKEAIIIRPNAEEKEDYEEIKEHISLLRNKKQEALKALSEKIFSASIESNINDINDTYEMARILEKLVIEYGELFLQKKTDAKVMDFNDIEHYCYKILEHEAACNYYKEKFSLIFIDEYQDTNVLQDTIIGKIKRDNNLFMVGDIKQSIYKFRLAEPEIFNEKYEKYKSCEEGKSQKIDLNKNYRSKTLIIKYINSLFENLMDNYDDNAMLYEGMPHEENILYKPELRIIDTETLREEDSNLAAMKTAELEALETCRVINSYIGKPYRDTKTGQMKKFTKRDIVILMRAVRADGPIFFKIMQEQGIEGYIDDADGYFDTLEINFILNLLTVINNSYQDVPLLAVLYSSVFNFTLEELGKIRANCKEGTFAEAFFAYKDTSYLGTKCAEAIKQITQWKRKAQTARLGDLIWDLLLETNYYVLAGAMPKGTIRQGNLRALVEKATDFQNKDQATLYNFIKYIEAVKEKKVSISQVKLVSEDEDVVRIMTIHKSKGLEFPLVIVAGMGKGLTYTRPGQNISLHKDIGIAIPLSDIKNHWSRATLLQKIIALKIREEEEDEQKRILYVAMTRAKDVLIMIGTHKKVYEYYTSRENGERSNETFLDMLTLDRNIESQIITNLEANNNRSKKNTTNNVTPHLFSTSEKEGRALIESIQRNLEFKYPYAEDTKVKKKYSVTEVSEAIEESHYRSGNELEENHYGSDSEPKEENHYRSNNEPEKESTRSITFKKPNFIMNKESTKLTGVQKGNVYHKIMEKIDLSKEITLEEIKRQCESLVQKSIITKEEKEGINIKDILWFCQSELGKKIINAFASGNLFREKPFTLLAAKTGLPQYENHNDILLQGIIDCYFVENGEIILVDYKSNYMNMQEKEREKERIKDTYSLQIKLYKTALEEATGLPVNEAFLVMITNKSVIKM